MSLTANKRKTMLIVIFAGAAVAAYLLLVAGSSSDVAATETEREVTTAEVVRTDLVEEVTFDGTLRTTDTQIVTSGLGGVVTTVTATGDTLVEGDAAYSVDATAVPVVYAETAFYRDLSVGNEIVLVTAPKGGTVTETTSVGTTLEQGDVLYSLNGEPVTLLFGDAPAYRTLYWPEPVDSSTKSTLASDVQADQQRQTLVQRIADATDDLATTKADLPSNQLLNAIDELTRLEAAGATDTEINRANQAVAAAQFADIESVERAELAIETANQALVDFDEVQAAAAVDEVANTTSTASEPNLTGTDVFQLETALAELGYDLDGTLVVDDEFTYQTSLAVAAWQTDIGAEPDGIIDEGTIVFVSGPAQIVDMAEQGQSLAPGSQVAALTAGSPSQGTDVLELEESLARQGYTNEDTLEVDGVYTTETGLAVSEWQTATGQQVDGVVSPTDVVLLKGPARVNSELASIGQNIAPGAPVVELASLEQTVTFELPATEQDLAQVGDRVTITLPDTSKVDGTVDFISQTATLTQDGSTVFEVEVQLDDQEAVTGLNEAPVDVDLVGTLVPDVLAVPVSALVALTEGGYAVEVPSGGGYALIAVDPGFFADGLVEIDATNIAAGDLVVLP